MSLWPLAFLLSTTLAAAGFVAVAIFWLRKLRSSFGRALTETATHQVRSTQRLSESMAMLQRQQQQQENQINELAELVLRMRQELTSLEGQLEPDQPDPEPAIHQPPHRTIH